MYQTKPIAIPQVLFQNALVMLFNDIVQTNVSSSASNLSKKLQQENEKGKTKIDNVRKGIQNNKDIGFKVDQEKGFDNQQKQQDNIHSLSPTPDTIQNRPSNRSNSTNRIQQLPTQIPPPPTQVPPIPDPPSSIQGQSNKEQLSLTKSHIPGLYTNHQLNSVYGPLFTSYVAKYITIVRIIQEENHVPLYAELITSNVSDKDFPELWRSLRKEVIQECFSCVRVLINYDYSGSENGQQKLGSGNGANGLLKEETGVQERQQLKRLGTFLGLALLKQGIPIMQKQLDLRQLILYGYQYGKLSFVIPFICSLLYNANIIFGGRNPSQASAQLSKDTSSNSSTGNTKQESIAFQNNLSKSTPIQNKIKSGQSSSEKLIVFTLRQPWICSIVALARELYDLPLKNILQFEFENLFKRLGIDIALGQQQDEQSPGVMNSGVISPLERKAGDVKEEEKGSLSPLDSIPASQSQQFSSQIPKISSQTQILAQQNSSSTQSVNSPQFRPLTPSIQSQVSPSPSPSFSQQLQLSSTFLGQGSSVFALGAAPSLQASLNDRGGVANVSMSGNTVGGLLGTNSQEILPISTQRMFERKRNEMQQLLENTKMLIDPLLNPDLDTNVIRRILESKNNEEKNDERNNQINLTQSNPNIQDSESKQNQLPPLTGDQQQQQSSSIHHPTEQKERQFSLFIQQRISNLFGYQPSLVSSSTSQQKDPSRQTTPTLNVEAAPYQPLKQQLLFQTQQQIKQARENDGPPTQDMNGDQNKTKQQQNQITNQAASNNQNIINNTQIPQIPSILIPPKVNKEPLSLKEQAHLFAQQMLQWKGLREAVEETARNEYNKMKESIFKTVNQVSNQITLSLAVKDFVFFPFFLQRSEPPNDPSQIQTSDDANESEFLPPQNIHIKYDENSLRRYAHKILIGIVGTFA
ncbi:MAG: hypothetical protein EZS28_033367, partial [Streblomastix strix]